MLIDFYFRLRTHAFFDATYRKAIAVPSARVVKASLARLNMKVATEQMKQKFLKSLGTLRRKSSEKVRYTPVPNRFFELPTRQRQSDSVSAADLRRDKFIYVTDQTRASLKDEQIEFFDELPKPAAVTNAFTSQTGTTSKHR